MEPVELVTFAIKWDILPGNVESTKSERRHSQERKLVGRGRGRSRGRQAVGREAVP